MKLTKNKLKSIIAEELSQLAEKANESDISAALEDAIEELPIELLVAAASDEELKEEYNVGGYRAGYTPVRPSGKSTFRQDQKDAENRKKARDSRLFAAEKKAKNARIAAQNHNVPIKNIESKINQVEQEVAESSRNSKIAMAAGVALSFALAGPIGGIIFATPAMLLATMIQDKMQEKSSAELGDELQKLKSKRKEMGDKVDVPSGRPPLSPLGPSNYFKETKMKLSKEQLKKMIKEELEKVLNEAQLGIVGGMDLGENEEAIKKAILNSPTYSTFEFQGTDKFKTVAEMMDTLDIGNMVLAFDGGVMSKKPRRSFSIVLPAYGETTDTGRALRIVYDDSDSGKELMKKGGNVVVVSKELDQLIKTIPVVNKYYNKG